MSAMTLVKVLQSIAVTVVAVFGLTIAVVAQDATRAVGSVVLSTPGGAPYTVTIPKGLIVLAFRNANPQPFVAFQTTQEVTMKRGARNVSVPIEAMGTGDCGNVKVGAIKFVTSGFVIVLSVTNAAPTHGGAGADCLAKW